MPPLLPLLSMLLRPLPFSSRYAIDAFTCFSESPTLPLFAISAAAASLPPCRLRAAAACLRCRLPFTPLRCRCWWFSLLPPLPATAPLLSFRRDDYAIPLLWYDDYMLFADDITPFRFVIFDSWHFATRCCFHACCLRFRCYQHMLMAFAITMLIIFADDWRFELFFLLSPVIWCRHAFATLCLFAADADAAIFWYAADAVDRYAMLILIAAIHYAADITPLRRRRHFIIIFRHAAAAADMPRAYASDIFAWYMLLLRAIRADDATFIIVIMLLIATMPLRCRHIFMPHFDIFFFFSMPHWFRWCRRH